MLGGIEAHQRMGFPSFEEDTALGVASTVLQTFVHQLLPWRPGAASTRDLLGLLLSQGRLP